MISHIKTMIPVRENSEVVIIYPDIYIYMVDGHPIHNKDPYNGYYKSHPEPLDD